MELVNGPWRCDRCDGPILALADGVVRLVARPGDGAARLPSLVHGPGGGRCGRDADAADLPLVRLAEPNGLVVLLARIDGKGLPERRVNRLMMRLFCEGFEAAHPRPVRQPAALAAPRWEGGAGRGPATADTDAGPSRGDPTVAADGRPRPPAARGDVLVVEEDDALRRLIAFALRVDRWTVVEAASAAEALAAASGRREPLAMLVTDATLSDMPGERLAGALRRGRPELPALVVSGDKPDRAAAGRMPPGPTAFLGAPFGMAELTRTLARLAGPPAA